MRGKANDIAAGAAVGAAVGMTALFLAAGLSPAGRRVMGGFAGRPAGDASEAAPSEDGASEAGKGAEAPGSAFHDSLAALGELADRVVSGEATYPEMRRMIEDVRDQGLDFLSRIVPTGAGRRWRHLKRGTTYEEIGRGHLHCLNDAPEEGRSLAVVRIPTGFVVMLPEQAATAKEGGVVVMAKLQASTRSVRQGDVLVVYRSVDDGTVYVRLRDEFLDGRFESIPAASPSSGNL